MQQNISFSDIRKNIIVIHQRRNRRRCIFRNLILVKTVKPVHLHQERQIERSRNPEQIILVDIELLFQHLQEPFIHLIFHFQPDHLAPLAFFQLFLDLF